MENYKTTKSKITSIAVPEQTRTYKPVSHNQLIDLTLEALDKAGFKVDNELYSSAKEGNVANAKYSISNVSDKEMQLQIAWQNSYDKSLSLKFAIGARVFICENGCVSGDMGSFKKKHQGSVQEFTPAAIAEYITRAGDVFTRMQAEREAMKNIILNRQRQAELIGRAFIDKNFITSTQMNIIVRELNRPTYNYGAPESLWELYQHFTHAMKDSYPSLWMENHINAHNFFVDQSGIPGINAIIDVPTPDSHPQLNLFDTNEDNGDTPS